MYSSHVFNIGLDDSMKDDIACHLDSDTCSFCGNSTSGEVKENCPQWSTEDVRTILLTQLKQSASLAAIFFLYAFSALRFGFVLLQHISRYQIDYV